MAAASKDIRAFVARAEELQAQPAVSFLKEIDSINKRRRDRMVDVTVEALGGRPLAGARVAVLGVAFKPESDDVRDSPALDIAQKLDARGAEVVVTDPRAMENARRKALNLKFAHSPEEAVNGADVVLLLTEWREYEGLDPRTFGDSMRHRRIIDGRNASTRRRGGPRDGPTAPWDGPNPQKTLSRGSGTTSRAAHSRTYCSCAVISLRRFHGRMRT